MKIAIIIVLLVAILGGVGAYFFLQKEPSSATSQEQLLGLWQRNEGDGFVFFLEFKENEFCPGGSGRTPEKFICSQYLPYSVSGSTIIVNDSPWAEWKIANDTLKLKIRSQKDEVIYNKVR